MTTQKQDSSVKIGKGMIYASWVLALLMLTLLFNNYLEKQHNPNQTISVSTDKGGAREVTLQQNRLGHYVATGFVNGQKVTFLLDTGATTISIPGNLANKLGLDLEQPHRVRTANGDTIAYQTMLKQVRLGSIELYNLKASIAPQMRGSELLLGMNFMRHLEMVQRDNQLTLRQH